MALKFWPLALASTVAQLRRDLDDTQAVIRHIDIHVTTQLYENASDVGDLRAAIRSLEYTCAKLTQQLAEVGRSTAKPKGKLLAGVLVEQAAQAVRPATSDAAAQAPKTRSRPAKAKATEPRVGKAYSRKAPARA